MLPVNISNLLNAALTNEHPIYGSNTPPMPPPPSASATHQKDDQFSQLLKLQPMLFSFLENNNNQQQQQQQQQQGNTNISMSGNSNPSTQRPQTYPPAPTNLSASPSTATAYSNAPSPYHSDNRVSWQDQMRPGNGEALYISQPSTPLLLPSYTMLPPSVQHQHTPLSYSTYNMNSPMSSGHPAMPSPGFGPVFPISSTPSFLPSGVTPNTHKAVSSSNSPPFAFGGNTHLQHPSPPIQSAPSQQSTSKAGNNRQHSPEAG